MYVETFYVFSPILFFINGDEIFAHVFIYERLGAKSKIKFIFLLVKDSFIIGFLVKLMYTEQLVVGQNI